MRYKNLILPLLLLILLLLLLLQQNRAARVITSSNYDVDVDSLFHKLSWKDLKSQRQIQNVLMAFKSLNHLVPELIYLTSKFIKRNESNYSLRDLVNKLVVSSFSRTNYMKSSFSEQRRNPLEQLTL